jgi:hypothetical protein
MPDIKGIWCCWSLLWLARVALGSAERTPTDTTSCGRLVVASDADVAAAYNCETATSLYVLGWSSDSNTLELPKLKLVEEDILVCEGESTQPRLVPPGLNIQGGCSFKSPKAVNFPSLETIGGSLVILDTNNLASVQFNALRTIVADLYELQGQGFSVVGNRNLSLLSLPHLTGIGPECICSRYACAGVNVGRNQQLTELALPALTSLPSGGSDGASLGPYVLVAQHNLLHSIALPSLQKAWTITLGSRLQGGPNASLRSLNLTSLVSIHTLTIEQSPYLAVANITCPACGSWQTVLRPTYKLVCVPTVDATLRSPAG